MTTSRRLIIAIVALLAAGLSATSTPAAAATAPRPPDRRAPLPSPGGLEQQVQRGEMLAAPGAAQAAMPFVAVTPRRLMDSRSGVGVAKARLSPNTVYHLAVVGPGTGNAEVASAVALNVTALGSTDAGFVTVWPCDTPLPDTSNLNFDAKETIPNAVVTRISSDGQVCFRSSVAVNLLVDSAGWFPIGSFIQPKTPNRLIDTRGPTLVPANTPLEVPVAGMFDVPTTVSATLLNVTVTQPVAGGFVTVYPCGQPVPDTSNLNFEAHHTVPNLVLAAAGVAGKTCVISSVATHVFVDVMAWFPTNADIKAQVPARILDTRAARPYGTPAGMIHANETLHVPLKQIPTGPNLPSEGAFLNVTAAAPQKAGFMTVWRCSDPKPGTSNLNFAAGINTANLVVTASDTNSEVCVFSDAEAFVIIDVNGLFVGQVPHAIPFTSAATTPLPAAHTTAAPSIAAPATQAKDWDNGTSLFPRGPWGYLTAAQTPKFMGQLVITAFDDLLYRCSGTVVDLDIILTAGHCVLDDPASPSPADLPRKAKSVTFTPARNGAIAPFGQWSTTSTDSIHPSQGYYDDLSNATPQVHDLDNTANDYALVTLAPNSAGEHIGEITGYVPVAPDLGRAPLTKVTLHYPAAGFFSAHCSGSSCMPMYCNSPNPPIYRAESFASTGRYVVGDGCPLMNGSSGGGVFSFFDGHWWTVSVISRGPDRTIDGDPTVPLATNGAYTVVTIGPELNSDAYPALLAAAKGP
jgi:hypothetical protein